MVNGTELPGLAPARLWAARRFPYLASAIFGCQVTAAPGIGTVSVDDRWRLRADPELVAAWTAPQLGSVLLHHVNHILRHHPERLRTRLPTPEDSRTWVKAADAEINDDLVPAGLDLPGHPVLPTHFGAPDGRLAEEYFEMLRTERPCGGTGGRSRSWEWLDCGSGADGQPRAWDDGDGGLDQWQADLLRRQVAQDVIRHAKEAGNVPAGLERWASEVLSPTVDWRRLLAAELRRAVADVAGVVDYSYRWPSRRAAAVPAVVLPTLRRPVPEIAVVCDTSGSMSDELLALALAEVEGLLAAQGLARRLRVLACDAAVGPVQRVSSARQVELTGGGGTDMGAGIAAAYALRPRPTVVVVLTDGYTPWPSLPPKGMRVVAGLLGDGARDAPPWIRAVRVTDPSSANGSTRR
jgi:predicted metal-dependent peptidase